MPTAMKVENQERRLSSRYPTEMPNEVVESQVQKIPNLAFMALAGVSIVGSVIVALRENTKTDFANFIGQWAPTFLLLGIYNKVVKLETEILSLQESRQNL